MRPRGTHFIHKRVPEKIQGIIRAGCFLPVLGKIRNFRPAVLYINKILCDIIP